MTYKERFQDLKDYAKWLGYKVEFVGNGILKDYGALNPEVEKQWGVGCTKCIYIDKTYSWEKKYRTLHHELEEMGLMEKGWKYWPAHVRSLKDEKN